MVKNDWNFEHSYASLPSELHTSAQPQKFAQLKPLVMNHELAHAVGIEGDEYALAELIDQLAQGQSFAHAKPLAQAYAGHQFGHFAILGDGRAMLLGEHLTSQGERLDVQLKGAGPTPYSRRGDGLATQSAMLREYLMGEAMHGLGIPTTRALAVLSTGELVRRQRVESGAILARVASSHLRVGTFEFAATRSLECLMQLTHYAMGRHDPQLSLDQDGVLAFLENVIDRQAHLVARWMSVGFVHGVMNTDNVTISGETLDFGPCAFIDEYDDAAVFSSIDQRGRYAYGQQPRIMHWNLSRLVQVLLPLLDDDVDQAVQKGQAVLDTFLRRYELYWQHIVCSKIGFSEIHPQAVEWVNAFLNFLQENQLDFTYSFRMLGQNVCLDSNTQDWHERLRQLWQTHSIDHTRACELMKVTNPAVIARNYWVDQLLNQMQEQWDASKFNDFVRVLKQPFDSTYETHELAQPRDPRTARVVTYCGT